LPLALIVTVVVVPTTVRFKRPVEFQLPPDGSFEVSFAHHSYWTRITVGVALRVRVTFAHALVVEGQFDQEPVQVLLMNVPVLLEPKMKPLMLMLSAHKQLNEQGLLYSVLFVLMSE
jgi:hypothetical protein